VKRKNIFYLVTLLSFSLSSFGKANKPKSNEIKAFSKKEIEKMAKGEVILKFDKMIQKNLSVTTADGLLKQQQLK